MKKDFSSRFFASTVFVPACLETREEQLNWMRFFFSLRSRWRCLMQTRWFFIRHFFLPRFWLELKFRWVFSIWISFWWLVGLKCKNTCYVYDRRYDMNPQCVLDCIYMQNTKKAQRYFCIFVERNWNLIWTSKHLITGWRDEPKKLKTNENECFIYETRNRYINNGNLKIEE